MLNNGLGVVFIRRYYILQRRAKAHLYRRFIFAGYAYQLRNNAFYPVL